MILSNHPLLLGYWIHTTCHVIYSPQGCTTGRHNNVKPPEPEKKVEKPLEKDEVINLLITILCMIITYIGLKTSV